MQRTPPSTQHVLWAAFAMMPVLFGIVAWITVPPLAGFPMPAPNFVDPISLTMTSAAAALLLGSFTIGFASREAPQRRVAGDGALDRRSVDPRYLVRLVLAESVAMLGLILTLLTHEPGAWVVFSAASLAAILAAYPRGS